MKFSASKSIRHATMLAFLFLSKLLLSQDPIVVSLTLLPPYPNFAYEVVAMGDQSIITLQNTDFNNAHSVKLGVELTGTNGIIVRSKESALPNQPINLGAGESLVLTGEDLSGFYNNYTESDFDFIGITMEEVLNDQQLPDGLYTLCVRAYDYNSGFPLSASSPSGCAAPFVVVAVDPPIITYPLTESVVDTLEPQLLNINWIPVSISLPDLRYRIEMVDITNMPINPYDAFLTGDFLFFWGDDIISNTFFYGMEYPLLEVGHEYAVRVRAYLLDGLLNVANGGYSDIVTFTYGDDSDDEDSLSTVGLTTIPDATLNCGSDCLFLLTGSETSGSEDPSPGDMLDFGHYQMFVSTIEGGLGNYSGTGIIQATPYIPIGIKVEFENVSVDENNRVIGGEAAAVIRENSWIDHTWADIQTFAEDININNYGDSYDAATNSDFYIDNLTNASQQIGTSIPISIGTQNHSLQIVGINFFPHRASYNLSYISQLADDPTTGERYLHFMSKDLCITPDGPVLLEEDAKLFLVKDFNYTFDNSTRLTFKADHLEQPGTSLSFDCNGYVGINAVGDVRFSPEVFIPVDDRGIVKHGDTLVATFIASYIDWSDWVGFVSFDSEHSDGNVDTSPSGNLFIYNELEDYIFRVEAAYLDHSINSNAPEMQFPENYPASGTEWQGIFIKTLRIDLPKWMKVYGNGEDRIMVSANDLLIDSDGLTGIIQATNVLGTEEGSLGKWPLTIDSLHIEVVQNSLSSAFFKGGLQLPVIDEPFDYHADLQFLEETTTHTFSFSPVDSYTFSKWFAQATLENNSKLLIEVENGNAFAEARLHGKLSFAPVIGDIDKMNLSDITFTDLVIRSEKRPSYIEIGNIGTNLSEKTLAIAGFGVIIDEIGWDESDLRDAGLSFMVGMDLADGLSGISGNTALFLKNKIEPFADSISFQFDGVSIKDINLAADAGFVKFNGKVSFFKNDDKFGEGFDGDLDLTIMESIALSGTVLFGNKLDSSDNTTKYWYAFAMASFPNSPVPFATPFDIYGFGGGVYYNMAVNQDFPSPGALGGSLVNPREAFIVARDKMGIQASVIAALTPSTTTFNAELTLTAEINLNTGGLNLVALTGAGYVMQKIDEPSKEAAMLFATGSITYDFPNSKLEGNFDLKGNVPKNNPVFNLNGEISFYRSPEYWYFKAGRPGPDKMITTGFDIGIASANIGGYLMTGMRLEDPVLPSEVSDFFQFQPGLVDNIQNQLGIGFMAGVHFDFGVDFSLGEGVIGVDFKAKAGLDIAILNYFAATCNESTDFGINKWYANGLGYIYGEAKLSIIEPIVEVKTGALVQAAFPNPMGAKGVLKIDLRFLDLDAFSYTAEYNFEAGSICNIEAMENADLMIEIKELELENMDLIGAVSPSNGEGWVNTAVSPTIQWHKKNKSFKRYVYGDGLGGIIDKLFRFTNESKWLQQNDNGQGWDQINYSVVTDQTDNISTFSAETENGNPTLISGLTDYKIHARTYIEEYEGTGSSYFSTQFPPDNWKLARYLKGTSKGEPIEEIVEHQFKTITNLTQIQQFYIDFTLPYERQRYYPYGYLSEGKIKFNTSHTQKFQDFEECGYTLKAEFTPLNSGSPALVEETSHESILELGYDMASLDPKTIYKLDIVAEREVTISELNADTEGKCKLNNGQTIQDLFDDIDSNLNLDNLTNQSTGLVDLGPGSQNTQFVNLQENANLINGIEPPINQRLTIFTNYFKTSKYATSQEKINSITVSEVSMFPRYIFVNPAFQMVKDAKISFNCGEPFDIYDIVGHPYENSNETIEYFRFYGPGLNTEGMETNVQNWYGQMNFQYYDHPNAQYIKNGYKIGKITYVGDLDNIDGAKIKYIKPKLSDAEVGLAEPEEFDISQLPLYVSNNTESSSTGNNDLGGLFNNTGGGGVSGFSIISSNNPELEVWFTPDKTTFYLRKKLLDYGIDFNFPYISTPTGTFPVTINLSNSNSEANENINTNGHKEFSIYIPF